MEVEKVCPSISELLQDRGKKDIVCPYDGCVKTLAHSGALNMHMTKVHGILKNEQSLKLLHRSMVMNKSYNYHCPVQACKFHITLGRFFKTITALKQHYHKVHAEKKFKCPRCCYGYGLEADFLRHISKCNVTFMCSDCHGSFSSKSELHAHCQTTQHRYMFSDVPAAAQKISEREGTLPSTETMPAPNTAPNSSLPSISTSEPQILPGVDSSKKNTLSNILIKNTKHKESVTSKAPASRIIKLPGNQRVVVIAPRVPTAKDAQVNSLVVKHISKNEFSRIVNSAVMPLCESDSKNNVLRSCKGNRCQFVVEKHHGTHLTVQNVNGVNIQKVSATRNTEKQTPSGEDGDVVNVQKVSATNIIEKETSSGENGDMVNVQKVSATNNIEKQTPPGENGDMVNVQKVSAIKNIEKQTPPGEDDDMVNVRKVSAIKNIEKQTPPGENGDMVNVQKVSATNNIEKQTSSGETGSMTNTKKEAITRNIEKQPLSVENSDVVSIKNELASSNFTKQTSYDKNGAASNSQREQIGSSLNESESMIIDKNPEKLQTNVQSDECTNSTEIATSSLEPHLVANVKHNFIYLKPDLHCWPATTKDNFSEATHVRSLELKGRITQDNCGTDRPYEIKSCDESSIGVRNSNNSVSPCTTVSTLNNSPRLGNVFHALSDRCPASKHLPRIAPKPPASTFVVIPPTFQGNIVMNNFNVYGPETPKSAPVYKPILPKASRDDRKKLRSRSCIKTELASTSKGDVTVDLDGIINDHVHTNEELVNETRLSISTQTSVPAKITKQKQKVAETQTAGDYILKKAMLSARLPIVKESRASQVSPRARLKRSLRESNTSETQTQMSPRAAKKKRRKGCKGCDFSVNTDTRKKGVSIGVGDQAGDGVHHDVSVQEIQTESESVFPLPSVEDLARIVESISTQTPHSFLATCTQVSGLDNTKDSEIQTRLHMDMGIDACSTMDMESLNQLGIQLQPGPISTGSQSMASPAKEKPAKFYPVLPTHSPSHAALVSTSTAAHLQGITTITKQCASKSNTISPLERNQGTSTLSKAPPCYEEATSLSKQYLGHMFASPAPVQRVDTAMDVQQVVATVSNSQVTGENTVNTSVDATQCDFDIPNFLSTEVQTIDFDYSSNQTQTDMDDDILQVLTHMQTQTNEEFWNEFGMSNMETQTKDSSFETMEFDAGINVETQTSRTNLQQSVEIQASIHHVENPAVHVISADNQTQTLFQDELANSQTQTKWEDLMNIQPSLDTIK